MPELRPSARFERWFAVGAGVVSVLAVIGMLAVEQLQVRYEIELWAPARVEGGLVPLRARVMTDLDDDEGPTLVVEGLRVAASRRGERVGEGALLERAALGTLEGEVPVGGADDGLAAWLAGSRGEHLAGLVRPLQVTRLGVERPRWTRRTAFALEQLAVAGLGRLAALVPRFGVRVEGGVCVPEEPCRLVFLRGESRVSPRLFECVGVDVGAEREEGAFATLDVVTHGAEARCRFALDPIAEETELQLPVGLATPRIELGRGSSGLVVRGEPSVGRDAALIDVYADGRWVMARTLRRGAALELPRERLGAGVVVVQARADVDSAEHAYQRAVAVGGDADAALDGLLGEGWRGVAGSLAEDRRWALLALEDELVDVAEVRRSRAGDEARLRAVRERVRGACAALVALALVILLVVVARRGLAATREARELMVAAGRGDADDRFARWHSLLTVLAFLAAIGLAVLFALGFLAARPFFMG